MKKQLLFVHGGEVFSTHTNYIEYLEYAKIDDPEYKEKKRWYYGSQLQSSLGNDWVVIRPDMPCKENAHYKEWKIWFEKYLTFLNDGAVLCGHSLGAMFLVRYVSEEVLHFVPSKIVLVAGAYKAETHVEGNDKGFFVRNKNNWKQLQELSQKVPVHMLHSSDDFVVPFENYIYIVNKLPNAHGHEFKDRGHFLQEEFEEFIKLVRLD